jgi:hypothetical protein
METLNKKQIDRFYKKLKTIGECLEWTGCVNSSGYGCFTIGCKTKKYTLIASRVSLYLHNKNDYKDNLVCLHKPLVCHNPKCCKPEHLYWGTQKDNHKDKIIDGTNRDQNGELNSMSKLNKQDVLKIRDLLTNSTLSENEIAKKFNIARTTISAIKLRRTWRHI